MRKSTYTTTLIMYISVVIANILIYLAMFKITNLIIAVLNCSLVVLYIKMEQKDRQKDLVHLHRYADDQEMRVARMHRYDNLPAHMRRVFIDLDNDIFG